MLNKAVSLSLAYSLPVKKKGENSLFMMGSTGEELGCPLLQAAPSTRPRVPTRLFTGMCQALRKQQFNFARPVRQIRVMVFWQATLPSLGWDNCQLNYWKQHTLARNNFRKSAQSSCPHSSLFDFRTWRTSTSPRKPGRFHSFQPWLCDRMMSEIKAAWREPAVIF